MNFANLLLMSKLELFFSGGREEVCSGGSGSITGSRGRCPVWLFLVCGKTYGVVALRYSQECPTGLNKEEHGDFGS
ncbi:hypothetical protein PoB_006418300 [Plakobranchus ocellatus]|uniref:Uncharacterized protein n=1 Tax=Plakobranchus ocellatus TaxID=259542 RepID=A0AAV4D0G5_9GAST|nr:hypothetical protein PoB_006418300 [Plakobranchus ocellatus]